MSRIQETAAVDRAIARAAERRSEAGLDETLPLEAGSARGADLEPLSLNPHRAQHYRARGALDRRRLEARAQKEADQEFAAVAPWLIGGAASCAWAWKKGGFNEEAMLFGVAGAGLTYLLARRGFVRAPYVRMAAPPQWLSYQLAQESDDFEFYESGYLEGWDSAGTRTTGSASELGQLGSWLRLPG